MTDDLPDCPEKYRNEEDGHCREEYLITNTKKYY